MRKLLTFLCVMLLISGLMTAAAEEQPSFSIDPSKPMVALTFDDGPGPYLPELLEVLRENNVHATFFVVGRYIANHPDYLQLMLDAGCEIGAHSWAHARYTDMDCNEVQWDLERTCKKIASVTNGYQAVWMRPPYGSKDGQTTRGVRYAGMMGVMWTLDTRDWENRNAEKTCQNILKQVEDGAVILCHETVPSTVEAMRLVLPQLIEQGYQVLSVSELFSFQQGGAQVGKIYSAFTRAAE